MPGAIAGHVRDGGGTSLDSPATPPAPLGGRSLAVGAVVAVGVLGALIWALRSGEGERVARLAAPAASPAILDAGRLAPAVEFASTTESVAPDPAATAGAFRKALAADRLYGTVEIVGDSLEIRSDACRDPALQAEIARFAAELRAGGVIRARCVELHGAEVFARSL